MRNFWRFHFIKVLLGIVVLQLLFFYWLQTRNHRPVAENDVVTVYEGHSVKISPLRNDTDKDEDELIIQKVNAPLKGEIVQIDNSLEYSAPYGFSGVDSFMYVISDGKKESKPAYIKVNVEENQKPVAVNDLVESYLSSKIPVLILGNDNDREGDSIFIHEIFEARHGKVEKQGNELVYIPSKKTALVDSFHYIIGDGFQLSEKATVTIRIKDKTDPCYPYLSTDIGGPAKAGNLERKNTDFVITASGRDIWGNQDNCHYAYQMADGNFEMVTKVKSLVVTDQWTKAGIMVRESLAANSKNAFVAVTGENGITAQQRMDTGSNSQSQRQEGALKAPYWLKMIRKGNNFTSLSSPDGKTWTEISSVEVPMPAKIYLGFAVTSHKDGEVTTVHFDMAKTQLKK